MLSNIELMFFFFVLFPPPASSLPISLRIFFLLFLVVLLKDQINSTKKSFYLELRNTSVGERAAGKQISIYTA